MIKTPSFWYSTPQTTVARLLPQVLRPFALAYGWAVQQRFGFYYPVPLSRPVLCVGNLVAGGAGKTPVVISLVSLMQERGYNPHILTRGYGGTELGPVQVSPGRDTAADVGDEALLLVDKAPTWVSKNRPLGAQAAIDSGASLILMDDGFQNPAIFKDFSLIVIDGAVGFGNGCLMPAGPLREDPSIGLLRAHAVVIIGDDKTDVRNEISQHTDIPVFSAHIRPDLGNTDLFGKKVSAFAGIGRPQKFKDSLVAAGAMLESWQEYPDHHVYTEEDLSSLMSAAAENDSILVTTVKDHVRLPLPLKEKIRKFSIRLEWQDPGAVADYIDSKLTRSLL